MKGMHSVIPLHWRIQGGAAGACPPPPERDPILSFLHTFSPKSARIGGRRPPLPWLGAPPQREILDLPLHQVHYQQLFYFYCVSEGYLLDVLHVRVF